MTNEININDTVRSFDFHNSREIEGPDACFVEGIVESFDGNHFVIKVTREVFEGENLEVAKGQKVRAPLNGLRTSRGRITDGVVKIKEPNPASRISEMLVSNLTDEQLDVIRMFASVAETHFESRDLASHEADACMRLLGRLRDEKDNRKKAA